MRGTIESFPFLATFLDLMKLDWALCHSKHCWAKVNIAVHYFLYEYYFSHPAAFSRALQKFQKYPWFRFLFPNQIVSVSGKKNLDAYAMKFCVFLWCQESLLIAIRPPHKLQCNCRGRMNGQQWPWHHKHS